MDLSTIRTRLRERIGNPDTTDVPNATLTLRINEALIDIQDIYNFNATKITGVTLVTAASDYDYTLPAAIDVLIGVRDNTNGVKLVKRDRVWWDSLSAATSWVNAKPTNYFRDGGTLYIYPPPDGVYTLRVRYRNATTELSADGDTPIIPLSWHPGVVLLARCKHWESIEDWPKYQVARQGWNDWASTKTDEVAEELKADYDQGVKLPDLAKFASRGQYDFDHED